MRSQVDAQGKAVYKDIVHLVADKFREKLYDAILQEYETVKAQKQTAEKGSVKDKLKNNKDVVKKKGKADKLPFQFLCDVA